MKERISLFAVLFLLMAAASLFSMCGQEPDNLTTVSEPEPSSIPSVTDTSSHAEALPQSTTETATIPYADFRILDESTGEILTVTNLDFLPGAIAVEMPLTYPEEALKAQAVASYTYYSRLRQQNRTSESPADADFSADPANWKAYVTPEQMEARWGSQFDKYYQKLESIAESVAGEALYYQGELALCAYHAISSGKTEASADIWGGACDYLVAVDSPGDPSADGYLSTVSVTPEQVTAAAAQKWPDADLSGSPESWFTEIQRTPSGTVETVLLGGIPARGADIRTAFGLRSANFDIAFQDNAFLFTVRGYGHGVGMSQTGAACLAAQGLSYAEILAWYYPGTVLSVPAAGTD